MNQSGGARSRSEMRDDAPFLQNAENVAGRIPRVGTLGWHAMPFQGMGSEMWWLSGSNGGHQSDGTRCLFRAWWEADPGLGWGWRWRDAAVACVGVGLGA